MHSPQNAKGDIKTNNTPVERLAFAEKLFANRKIGSWDYIRSRKVPPLYLRLTLHATNRPANTRHFWLKNSLPKHAASRLQRWRTILLNNNFKIEYVPSKTIGYADGLLRLIPNTKNHWKMH